MANARKSTKIALSITSPVAREFNPTCALLSLILDAEMAVETAARNLAAVTALAAHHGITRG
jgi:hypothetical protein